MSRRARRDPARMLGFLNPDGDVDVPLGRTGFVLERQRRFVRKSVTLGVAIVTLAPLLWWKSAVGAAVYLAALVVIHVAALAVFVHRVEWRNLVRHKGGLAARAGGLVVFGALLAMLRLDAASPVFWGTLTLLWLLHVAALALLHVRHRREMEAARP